MAVGIRCALSSPALPLFHPQPPPHPHWFLAPTPPTPPSLTATAASAASATLAAAADAWDVVRPGGRLHPAAFLAHKGHLALEALLALTLAYLLTTKPKRGGDGDGGGGGGDGASVRARDGRGVLSPAEVDALVDEWTPVPLVPPATAARRRAAGVVGGDGPLVKGGWCTHISIGSKRALNCATFNFLGLAGDPTILAAAKAAVVKYGVGSCGPRGFYGTIDVHLELEASIARFMGSDEAILYSYDLATMPSVLPAFANAKDIIVLDGAAPWAHRNGAALSRARVFTFPHNDAAALDTLLTSIAAADRAAKRPPCRRFVVVEGVSTHAGDVAPLPEIVAVAKKHAYRTIVDESLALGALGATGRGACEHHGLAPGTVDVVVASLGGALASVGGFCAASREIVDHQRLSGLGYCFSASLPPFLAVAARTALDRLAADGPSVLLPALARNARLLRALAADVPGLVVVGDSPDDATSPVLHVRLASPPADPADALDTVKAIAADALAREGVFFCAAVPPPLDGAAAPPSLRLTVTAAHTENDVRRAAAALRAAARRVLGRDAGAASSTSPAPAGVAGVIASSPLRGRPASPSAGWAASPVRPDLF